LHYWTQLTVLVGFLLMLRQGVRMFWMPAPWYNHEAAIRLSVPYARITISSQVAHHNHQRGKKDSSNRFGLEAKVSEECISVTYIPGMPTDYKHLHHAV